ncbi:MAG: beta-galactosidase, partial [Muribaculaceae bacterium]|nr:beta-galactosidase [Muribaculaceae bacterium]
MKKKILALVALLPMVFGNASAAERQLFDDGWKFALGNASDPAKDFGCGTEYFNYLTKANSIHNEGPYSPKFNTEKSGAEWKDVTLTNAWEV